jgi:hypothetical protein
MSIWTEPASPVVPIRNKQRITLHKDQTCSYWSEDLQAWQDHVPIHTVTLRDLFCLAKTEQAKLEKALGIRR